MGWPVSALAAFGSKQEPRLPALRQDLEIMASGTNFSGAPSYVLYDPLQHRYFQINHETRALLSVWSDGLTVTQ